MTARLLLLAVVVASVGYGRCLWIWDNANNHRAEPPGQPKRKREGAQVYLDVLKEMDPSPKTLAYIERRRAEIEAETA